MIAQCCYSSPCLYMLARGTLAQGTTCIMSLNLQCCLKMPMNAAGSWPAFLLCDLFLDQGGAL